LDAEKDSAPVEGATPSESQGNISENTANGDLLGLNQPERFPQLFDFILEPIEEEPEHHLGSTSEASYATRQMIAEGLGLSQDGGDSDSPEGGTVQVAWWRRGIPNPVGPVVKWFKKRRMYKRMEKEAIKNFLENVNVDDTFRPRKPRLHTANLTSRVLELVRAAMGPIENYDLANRLVVRRKAAMYIDRLNNERLNGDLREADRSKIIETVVELMAKPSHTQVLARVMARHYDKNGKLKRAQTNNYTWRDRLAMWISGGELRYLRINAGRLPFNHDGNDYHDGAELEGMEAVGETESDCDLEMALQNVESTDLPELSARQYHNLARLVGSSGIGDFV
jgi:hypothetical protein